MGEREMITLLSILGLAVGAYLLLWYIVRELWKE